MGKADFGVLVRLHQNGERETLLTFRHAAWPDKARVIYLWLTVPLFSKFE